MISEKSDSIQKTSPIPPRSSQWYEDNDYDDDSGGYGIRDGDNDKSHDFDDGLNKMSPPKNDDVKISDKVVFFFMSCETRFIYFNNNPMLYKNKLCTRTGYI